MVQPADFDRVHEFWFGKLGGKDDLPMARTEIWFRVDPQTDAEIAREFGALIEPAAAEAVDGWTLTPEQRVGRTVLLDQFPRNIFRKSGRSFAFDAAARRCSNAYLAEGSGPYRLVERAFLYLPFEHSEAMADQLRSIALFTALAEDAPTGQKGYYDRNLEFAVKHRDLIARFGRFPHRNEDLGRPSTPEELVFIAESGRGY